MDDRGFVLIKGVFMKSKKPIVLLLILFYSTTIFLLLHGQAFAPQCPCETCTYCCDCQYEVCLTFSCDEFCYLNPECDLSWSLECRRSCKQAYDSCLGNCGETTTTTIPLTTTTTTIVSTIIELSYFTAIPRAGKVILTWSTESEIDNAGFNLYRSTSENGEYISINDSLIPAQGSPTQGASYEFVDKDVKNRKTYYYKLEDIDLNGTSTMHGPVSATPRWIFRVLKI
jgi:hypothetical protein